MVDLESRYCEMYRRCFKIAIKCILKIKIQDLINAK